MITVLLMFCYLGCVFVAFKVIKIKVNPVSVTVATLISVGLLGGMVIGWTMAAPMTGQMTLRRRVLQVVPDVKELVSKVYAEPDQKVKKGDPLFEIRPDRFQNAVDQAKAQLTAAQATVSQLEAGITAAQAAVKKSEADTAASKAELDTALALHKVSAGAISKLKVEEAQQGYRAAQADDKVQEASLKQSQFSLASAKHSVDVAAASLKTANFNLERCTYRSPVDGQVINWQIREGTPVNRFIFTGAGTVQDFSDNSILAIFRQNRLKNVKPGNKAEIAFKRRPGQIVTGKVSEIIPYTGEGEMIAGALVPSAANFGSQGFLAVRIYLDDEQLARDLPLGAAGTTAIYTDVGESFHVFTKITVRVKAWMNYVPM
jgi:multidrug resistance efflux pump